jgi:hypothetical protein
MKSMFGKWILIVMVVAALLISPLPVLGDSHADTANTVPQFSPSQEDGTIEGYVRDGHGIAVDDAYVCTSEGPGYGEAYTDNYGYYSMSGLLDGPYTVIASPPYGSSLLLWAIHTEVVDAETTTLDFVLPEGGAIAGRVTNEGTAGIYNAYVSVSEGPSWGEAYADSQGDYSLGGLRSGTYTIYASPPNGANLLYGITTVQVLQGETTTLDFVLPAGGAIAGRVTDYNGDAVYNAAIGAYGPGSGYASSDNQGYYLIMGLPGGDYTVDAYPPEEADLLPASASAEVTVSENTTLDFVLLELVQGTISGRVTDNNETGISGVQVTASGLEDSGYAYTNSSGDYSIDGLRVGSYTVTATPSTAVNLVDASATDVQVEDDTTTTQNFELVAGGVISGQVTDESDQPVYLAWVYASGPGSRATYTDVDGDYSIVGLPGDDYEYTVTVHPGGGNLLSGTDTAIVHLGETTTLDIVLSAGGIIAGRVTNEAGAGLFMSLVSAYGPTYAYDYTDNQGYYSIVALNGGSYTVSAYPPAGPSGINVLSASVTGVVAVEGSSTTRDFTLPWGGVINGRVTDGNGAGVYNTYIYTLGAGTNSDADGYYSIVGLKSGSYTVGASPPPWSNLISSSYPADVTQGENTTVDFDLSWGGIIEGRVTDEDGAGVYYAYMTAEGPTDYGYAYTDSRGYYSIVGLPSDNYTVTAYLNYEGWLVPPPEVDVPVIEGETTTMDLILPQGGVIDGRVTDGEGAGVSYAYVEAYGQADYGYAYADWGGYYTIVGLQSDNYTITATALYDAGLSPGTAFAEVIEGETTPLDIVLLPPDTTPPPRPWRISPPHGYQTDDDTPSFDWSDVSDPSGVTYWLQIAYDYNFTSLVLDNNGLATSDYTLAELESLADGPYYWRVCATDGALNQSAWTSGWGITVDTTAPARPWRVSPPNGYQTEDTTPSFDWSDVSDPTGVTYWLQIAHDYGFTSLVLDKDGLVTSDYTLTGLETLTDAKYYWRVCAMDSLGHQSAWTSGWPITVDTAAPARPWRVSPPNGYQTEDTTPSFDWSDVSDSSGVTYWLQIAYDYKFTSLARDKQGLVTSDYTLDALEALADGKYYWRVCAMDSLGHQSAWTSGWTITVDTAAPARPWRSSPPNGYQTENTTPSFDWSNVSDPTGVTYRLQIAYDYGFTSLARDNGGLVTSDYTLTELEALTDGKYYWRVCAVDGLGHQSAWTSGWALTVDTTAPARPWRVSPPHGYETADTTPSFDWSDVSDPTGVTYRLQIAYDYNFTSLVRDKGGLATSDYTLAALEALDNGSYYWRVCAVDGLGHQSTWTSGWLITIAA